MIKRGKWYQEDDKYIILDDDFNKIDVVEVSKNERK